MGDDTPIGDLFLSARFGERLAWDALVERLAPLLWSICRRYRLPDADADDVAQSVWLKLLERLTTINDPAALPGWLATTTERECLRVRELGRRRLDREQAIEDDVPADPGPASAERLVEDAERNAAIRAGFALLSPRCQELLKLLLHDPPLSYVEIGRRLDTPVGGLGPTRARCLDKLRRSDPVTALLSPGPDGDRR
ncbi:RNA polymerase sigma factor [Geodermatophilus sp. SYSU D00815]